MRIVFTDLDDTLLASDKTVPPENQTAVARLAELGIPFVPCTGRPLKGLSCAVAALPGVTHIVSSDGVVVYEVELDDAARDWLKAEAARDPRAYAGDELARCCRVLNAWPMGPERCVALYERLKDLDITFDVFGDGTAWSERPRWERLASAGLEPHLARLVQTMRVPCDEKVPQIVERQQVVERVTVWWWNPGDRERVLSAVNELGLVAVSSGLQNLEITAPEASKGAALVWLCDHLGIDVADAVAFGDALNDAAMLQAAGDGVAMLNATDEAKAQANHVTAFDHNAGGEGRYLLDLLA